MGVDQGDAKGDLVPGTAAPEAIDLGCLADEARRLRQASLGVAVELTGERERFHRRARMVSVDQGPSAEDQHAHDAESLVGEGAAFELVEVDPARCSLRPFEEPPKGQRIARNRGSAVAECALEQPLARILDRPEPRNELVRDRIALQVEGRVTVGVLAEQQACALAIAVAAGKRDLGHTPSLKKHGSPASANVPGQAGSGTLGDRSTRGSPGFVPG